MLDEPRGADSPQAFVSKRVIDLWREPNDVGGLPGVSRRPVIDLSRDYDLGTVPNHVSAAVIRSLERGETHYTNRPGLPALMEAVADKLERQQGISVDGESEVTITCGGREGVFLALHALVESGRHVLVPALRAEWVDRAIRLADCTPVPIVSSSDCQDPMTADDIRRGLSDGTGALLLLNPSNPTGRIMPPGEASRIATLAKERDWLIISDESLDESLEGSVRHKSIAAFPDAKARTVMVGSFSFLHNLAPWRVGYMAGVESLLGPVRSLKRGMTLCTSAMAQYAALQSLEGPQDWLAQRRSRLDERRAFLMDALDDMHLAHSDAEATPYLFVDIRESGRNSEAFAAWSLGETGVVVLPGGLFGPKGEGHVRLSLWSPLSELTDALARWRAAL